MVVAATQLIIVDCDPSTLKSKELREATSLNWFFPSLFSCWLTQNKITSQATLAKATYTKFMNPKLKTRRFFLNSPNLILMLKHLPKLLLSHKLITQLLASG